MHKIKNILATSFIMATVLSFTGLMPVKADDSVSVDGVQSVGEEEYINGVLVTEDDLFDPDYKKMVNREDIMQLYGDDSEDTTTVKGAVAVEETKLSGTAVNYASSTKSILTSNTYYHESDFADKIILDGIDISKWQGDIDWNKVKKSGIDFVIIRIGCRSLSSSGTITLDPKFAQNIVGAKNAGIEHIGVYFFSQAITEKEAIEEAQFVVDNLRDYDINMPIVMDVEDTGTGAQRYIDANLTPKQRTQYCNAFAARVKEYGYSCMIYSGAYFLRDELLTSQLEDCDIWIANYTKYANYNPKRTEKRFSGDFSMWQYASTGKVNGITGDVDSDFWYCDKEEAATSITDPKSITLSKTSVSLKSGSYTCLSATILPNDIAYDVSWSSLDPAIAYVSQDGKVVGVGKGKTVITAKVNDKVTATCTVTVKEPLSNFKIAELSSTTYTGKNITKKITVSSKSKVVYSATVDTDVTFLREGAGTDFPAVVTLKKGDSLKVVGKITVLSKVWYAAVYKDENGNQYTGYVVAGNSKENYLKLYANTVTLTSDKDYIVTYENNKNPGLAKVTVSSASDRYYTGTLSTSFAINPTKVTGVTPVKRGVLTQVIKWNKVPLVTCYCVYRSEAYDGTYKKLGYVSATKTEYTDKTLNKGKCYYYKVVAIKKYDGNYYYGGVSDVCTTYTANSKFSTAKVVKNTNIYNRAGISYKKVCLVKSGSKLNKVIAATLAKDSSLWYYVEYKSGSNTYKGYVKASCISFNMKGTVNASTLNVRKGPATTYAILTTLKKNATVNITDELSGWYKIAITINKKLCNAYVCKDFIKIV